MKSKVLYVGGFLLFCALQTNAQTTILGPEKISATIAGKTYQKTLARPTGVNQAELIIQNGLPDLKDPKQCPIN